MGSRKGRVAVRKVVRRYFSQYFTEGINVTFHKGFPKNAALPPSVELTANLKNISVHTLSKIMVKLVKDIANGRFLYNMDVLVKETNGVVWKLVQIQNVLQLKEEAVWWMGSDIPKPRIYFDGGSIKEPFVAEMLDGRYSHIRMIVGLPINEDYSHLKELIHG